MTGHTRSSRRLPYSEVGPGPVDLEAVASMADLAAAAAVIAGPPTPVEMRLFSVGSNSSFESASWAADACRDAPVLCWLKQLF